MAFAPPRKPSGGSRIPSSIRKTSVQSVSSSSMARSTASSTRGGSCSTGAPCGSSVSSRSGARGGPSQRGPARSSMVETTSSTIIEPGRTVTTTTERRTGAAAARSSGYGPQRPSTAPQTAGRAPRYQPPRSGKSSGYGMPGRTSGVCPGASGSARRQPSSARGTIETVTSTSSMTIDPDGTETVMETEERVIQPAPSAKSGGVCSGGQRTAGPSMLRHPGAGRPSTSRSSIGRQAEASPCGRPSIPRPSPPAPCGRPSIPRPAAPAPCGRPSIPRPAAAAPCARPSSGLRPPRATSTPAPPATQKVTTRTSRTTFSDGRNVEETSTRTERTPAPARRTPVASAVSSTSVTSSVSTGAMPKPKTVTTRTSKTSVTCGKKTRTVQEVTKTTPQSLPEGRYALSLKHPPHTKEGRYAKFSSPPELRHVMDREMPKQIKSSMMPPEYRGIQDIRKLKALPPYKDTVSCAMDMTRGRAPAQPSYYSDPHEYSFLESRVEPEQGVYSPRRDDSTILEQEVGEALIQMAAQSPGKMVKVSGSRKSPGKSHIIMTDEGPVTATEQVITEKRVEKVPGAEKISRHIIGIEKKGCGAIQTELDTQELEPGAGLPAKGDTAIETVSITSSVAIAPGGIKETTTTVIYETTKPPSRSPKIQMSPEQLERLVEEESIDVNKTLKLKPIDLKVASPTNYPTRKKEHALRLNYSSVAELEQSIVQPEPNADQEQEEAQPEMMATIMYTEETKIGLEAHPAQMYDILFPDQKDTTMMTVSSVVPIQLQDVLVPHQLPEEFHQQGANQEIQDVIAHVETKGEIKPAGNAFCEATGQQVTIKNAAKRKTKKLTDIPMLAEEMPPWGVEDMQPIIDIVGAPIHTSLTVHPVEDGQEEAGQAPATPEEDDSVAIDYMLQLEPPTHISRIQLRGSTRPPWFQGYYVALPEIPNLVRVEKTAESALISAWRSVQPNIFPEDSIISV